MIDLPQKLSKLVKLSQEQRQGKQKWLAKQNEELQLEAFIRQQKYYFELSKHKNENKSLLYFAAHTLAVNKIYDQINLQKRKNKVINIKEVSDATSLQTKHIVRSKNSKKYDKLLNLKSKILTLKDHEDLSFRQISELLRKFHRIEVSHSYIATFYHNIKEKK